MMPDSSRIVRRIFLYAALAAAACWGIAAAAAWGIAAVTASSAPIPQRGPRPPVVPGPMLEQGTVTFDTPDLTLVLVKSSQTVAAVRTKAPEAFDFTPGDLLAERSRDGYYHLGDLDLRVRAGTSGEWRGFSTAAARTPVTPLATGPGDLAAADLAPTMGAGLPLKVIRTWRVERGALVLRFALTNPTTGPVQVGALGIPMVFNNVLSNRSLDQAHTACVFYDPYIGMDAGYVQVARLTGRGPVLLVTPDGRTPLEAWNPIMNPRRPGGGAAVAPPPTAAGVAPAAAPLFTDATPRGQTFEGFFDWMAHSQAVAEAEWKDAEPWNPPSMATLAPGETRTYGVAFLLAPDLHGVERTLAAHGRPVAVGVPGYILPMDVDGRLFLQSGRAVRAIDVEPRGALEVRQVDPPRAGGWREHVVRGRQWGRARLTLTYDDGSVQTVHYKVIKAAATAVADLGRFLTTRQWFVDPADPFRRSPSVMTFDRETNQIVTQDSRVWIAGLGDEGGSSWLTGVTKQLGQPDPGEIAKYQEFVDRVLWGGLQYADGPKQFAVRKSLFYYAPDERPAGYYRNDLNWTTWTSWKKEATEAVDRSYDYPHVAALHWVMYRLARNRVGLVTNHPWDWYLTRAWKTGVAMTEHAPHYAQFGQMEGTVFLEILRDLRREGWTAEADAFEAKMKARADIWSKLAYPYGSEMAWDSTGQEEVFAWTTHFGDAAKARVTLDAVLCYMPTLPHWGYNGSARRYWDFLYGGKTRRIERQLHHYGSGLNAIPVLAAFRAQPDDDYLLRVGYGGAMGALANIDEEGFAAAAFHAFPDTLKPDAYSGDYAQNFLGHALNAATYLVRHPVFGWLAFGGNVAERTGRVVVTPLDAFRMRVYLAPVGLWLTLDAGRFERVSLDSSTRAVRAELAAATPDAPVARLRVELPARPVGDARGAYRPARNYAVERDAFVIPLGRAQTIVDLALK
jgi:hypothetical protein